jgi:hypothetical protein
MVVIKQGERRHKSFFNPEINIGTILQIIGMIVAGLWFLASFQGDISKLTAAQRFTSESVESIKSEVNYIRIRLDKHMDE